MDSSTKRIFTPDEPGALGLDEVLKQVAQDDEDEWEYEYSTTETEVVAPENSKPPGLKADYSLRRITSPLTCRTQNSRSAQPR